MCFLVHPDYFQISTGTCHSGVAEPIDYLCTFATSENFSEMMPGSSESRGARFGCGFVFGLVLAGIGGVGAAFTDGKLFLAITIVVSVIFGLAAMRFGDRFWRWVKKWLS